MRRTHRVDLAIGPSPADDGTGAAGLDAMTFYVRDGGASNGGNPSVAPRALDEKR